MNLQDLYADYDDYDNLKAADLIKSGVITSDMLDTHNALLNAFGGKIRIMKSEAQEDSDAHDAFILIYDGLPAEACFKLATLDWKAVNDGFIGIKATPNGTADVRGAYKSETFEKRPSGTVYHPYEAQNACGKGNSSSVALKFE